MSGAKKIRIRITVIPPGTVSPLMVRQAWVGLELPAVQNFEEDEWTGNENAVSYDVSKVDAIEALLGARCKDTADFWLSLPLIKSFTFGARDCELVNE